MVVVVVVVVFLLLFLLLVLLVVAVVVILDWQQQRGTDLMGGCFPQVLQIRELLDAKQQAALADQAYRQSTNQPPRAGEEGGVEEGTAENMENAENVENVVLDATDRENVARLFAQQKGHRLSEEELDVVMGNEMGQQLALQLRMLAERGA